MSNNDQKNTKHIWGALFYAVLAFAGVVYYPLISQPFGDPTALAMSSLPCLLFLNNLLKYCRPYTRSYTQKISDLRLSKNRVTSTAERIVSTAKHVVSAVKKSEPVVAKIGIAIAVPSFLITHFYYIYTVVADKMADGDPIWDTLSVVLMLLLAPGIPMFFFWRMVMIKQIMAEEYPEDNTIGESNFRWGMPTYKGLLTICQILFNDFSDLKDKRLDKIFLVSRIIGFSLIALLAFALAIQHLI